MAEEQGAARDINWRQLLPWTELFRFLQIALDAKKVLLAAGGILITAIGWVFLSWLFTLGLDAAPPALSKFKTDYEKEAWPRFKEARDQWNILHEATGRGGPGLWEVADIAQTEEEHDRVSAALAGKDRALALLTLEEMARQKALSIEQAARYKRLLGEPKPSGTLAVWPWSEDRGPNPFLLVTGQAGVPWEAGHFWEWFTTRQAPVMLEPVVKLIRPVVYFFSPRANGFVPRLYFLCILLWTLVTWSFFGGAITRIAAVQIARGETIGLGEAFRFTQKRLLSFVMAPLFPLIGVVALTVVASVFGLFFMIPVLGDLVIGGLLWFLFLIFGLGMALALVGLVGWPLMAATISTEGTDAWEAVSRSFGYVYQRPWQFLWNSLVAVTYGGIVIFFIGFMGSFAVYLSKWSVSQTPFIQSADRDPSFLFVHAPRSFGWRTLLLQGVKVDGQDVVHDGAIDPAAYDAYMAKLRWWNLGGARIVQFWLIVMFLLMLGVGYSLFWTEVTIIYLLLRRDVEGAEMDEVHLEDDELEGQFAGGYVPTPAPPAAPAARPGGLPLTTVDPPVLRAAPEPPPAPPVTDVPPPA